MKVIENESNIFVDVDDTLVMWDWDTELRGDQTVAVQCPYEAAGIQYVVRPNLPNIKVLMNQKARGSYITVWSQNGYQWAEAVVKALGLEEYVDQAMSKPRMYMDDLPCQNWMGERVYLSPDSKYGQTGSEE